MATKCIRLKSYLFISQGTQCKEYLQKLDCSIKDCGLQVHQRYPSRKSLYIESTCYKLGQMGGTFFTVTNEFFGSSISVLFTYVLVVIQFSR